MTAALLLLGYSILLATAGTAVLRRAGWTRRAPRLAILAWYALSLSMIGSVLLAGLTVAMNGTRGDAARRCDAPARWTCSPAITTAGAAVAVASALAVLAVTARVIWCLTRTHAAASRKRREQLDVLAVLGRPDDRLGVTVIDHAAPAAYCLPGRHGRVVVTTAALGALDDDRLAAVLAHERAHLRQRHHLLRTTAEALAEALPCVPALAIARDEVARLAELAADDAAARRSGRLTVAAALLALAEAMPVAAPALTAGGTTSAARARRLIGGERPLGHVRVLLGLAATVIVISAPMAAMAAVTATTPVTSGAGCCTTAQQVPGAR
jgi:Zn-dependent protease with chaperone function